MQIGERTTKATDVLEFRMLVRIYSILILCMYSWVLIKLLSRKEGPQQVPVVVLVVVYEVAWTMHTLGKHVRHIHLMAATVRYS